LVSDVAAGRLAEELSQVSRHTVTVRARSLHDERRAGEHRTVSSVREDGCVRAGHPRPADLEDDDNRVLVIVIVIVIVVVDLD
jgi:hypothetical protein